MKKVIIQGLVTVLFFVSLVLVFKQVDWMNLFKVKQATDKTEQKLGEIFWDVFKKSNTVNQDPFVVNTIDTIITKICAANDIDKTLLKVHVFEKDEINAFALPDGYLVVYSGLIVDCQSQEELIGVICHELAHIQLKHVMKKLVKEMGLSVLIGMTTGNGGNDIIQQSAHTLSSTAFDRKFESEADLKSVDYMVEANVNPNPFADFLYKLSHSEGEAMQYLTWISTHPDSQSRSEAVVNYAKDKTTTNEKIIAVETWNMLIEKLKMEE